MRNQPEQDSQIHTLGLLEQLRDDPRTYRTGFQKMAASCNDCGGGLRFDITDRGCTFRLAFEGLAMGPLIAGSHRRNCRTRLLRVARSIEQRTV